MTIAVPTSLETQALVNEYFGIVHSLQKIRPPECLRGLHWIYAEPRPTSVVLDIQALNEGSGVSEDPERACWKALGESVERYCSAAVQNSVFQPSIEMRDASLEKYRLYPREAYSFLPFDPIDTSKKLNWFEGKNLISGKPELVPSQFVYIPYKSSVDEAVLDDQDSTGLACSYSLENAVEKAMLEVVERDAFMKWWTGELSTMKWQIGRLCDLSTANKSLLDCVTHSGLKVELCIALPIAGVFWIAAMIRCDHPFFPNLVFGFGCARSFDMAVRLSLEEGLLSFLGYSERLRLQASHALPFDEPKHSKPFLYASSRVASQIVLQRIETFPKCLIPNEIFRVTSGLELVTAQLLNMKWTPVLCDLTTPDIRDVGLNVVKVVIPEARRLDRRFIHGTGIDIPYDLAHPFP
jgi:ribosomal protein S12 methylthiotransferase accessory factor